MKPESVGTGGPIQFEEMLISVSTLFMRRAPYSLAMPL